MCELGEVRFRIGGMDGLERVARAPVQVRTPGGAQLEVERVANQDMGEGDAVARARGVDQHALGDGLLQEVDHPRARQSRKLRQLADPEDAAEDRGLHQQLVACPGQVTESTSGRLANALGNDQPGTRLVNATFRQEQAHDLADEERVAFGLHVDRGEHVVRRLFVGDELDVAPDLGGRHSLESDAVRVPFARQLRERDHERLAHPGVHVAVRREQQQSAFCELSRNELKEQERGLVGRMHVVQDDHDRSRVRADPKKVRDGFEESETRRVRFGLRRLRQLGELHLQIGQQLREVGRGRSKVASQFDRIRLAGELTQ
jgi:hypothetical protein